MTLEIIAPSKRKHAEAIFDLVAEEWSEDLRRHSREGRINRSHYSWTASRVGLMDGNVITHFGVYDIKMRVGAAYVRTAGVNLVVTHPDYRNRGAMPRTTRASIEAMREEGYGLSIVGYSIPNYYTRFGYVVAWPDNDYFISVRNMPPEPPTYRLQSINPTKHRAAFDDLYNQANIGITGTAVRPTFRHTKEPGDLLGCLWKDAQGNLAGYIIYDRIPESRALWHYDSAGDPGEILRVFHHLARRINYREVRFNRLPHNSGLAWCLRALDSTAEIKYSRNGGWLVRVINLNSLFTSLRDELWNRLTATSMSGWRGNLLISTGEESITLSIGDNGINIGPAYESEHSISGGQEIARLVIGTSSPVETVALYNTQLAGDAAKLIKALFPAQNPQMGGADL